MTENLSDLLNAKIVKHSVTIAGHSTSISIEQPFWISLKKIAADKNIPLARLINEIDDARSVNLSSAIRLYVLHHLK